MVQKGYITKDHPSRSEYVTSLAVAPVSQAINQSAVSIRLLGVPQVVPTLALFNVMGLMLSTCLPPWCERPSER